MSTKRFKNFGTGSSRPEDREPLSFELYDETFECYPAVPGKVLLSLAATSAADDGAAAAKTITTFFEKVLKPESFERFDKLAGDPERVVTVETLSEIVAWLMENYAERPTQEPTGSLSGQ